MDSYMVEILAIRILPTMLFDNRCAILMLLTKAARPARRLRMRGSCVTSSCQRIFAFNVRVFQC